MHTVIYVKKKYLKGLKLLEEKFVGDFLKN